MVSLTAQIHTFLIMLAYGLVLGFLFQLYRGFTTKLKKKWILNLLDLSFGLSTGLMGFLLLLDLNWGKLRFFVFFAIFSGFLLYLYLSKRIKILP